MNFIMGLPKGLFVGIVLVVGLVLIIAANPPHTLCDTQVESLKQNLRILLFPQEIHGILEKPRLLVYEKACKEANSSGGCYEWLLGLHKVADNLLDVPSECSAKVMSDDSLRGVVDRALSLVARLAWGEKPPETPYEKKGWLEESDVALYCDLIEIKSTYQSKEDWESLRHDILMKLPGADTLGYNEAWKRSIVSVDCRIYQ